jgi:hypothetical protein
LTPRSLRAACWIIAVGGFLLRIATAVRTLDVVDRMFVPDDTYYTLTIARSMAHGLGATADGIHITNGFQPLVAFLMVPVYWLTSDFDLPLRIVWIILSACDIVTAVALGSLAARASRSNPWIAALTATTAWALSPLAVSYALGGLETSLSLMILVLLTLAWVRARESRTARDFVLAGILAGLALLARIDSIFLVALLGAFEVLRGSRVGALRAAGAAAVVVSPWWGYELLRLHTIVPSSGEAVRQQVAIHQAIYLTTQKQLAWALGTALEAPTGRLYDLRDIVAEQHGPPLTYWGTGLTMICLALATWRFIRKDSFASPIRLLCLNGAVIWLFYALYVPALWFLPRYMSPMHLTFDLLLALGVAEIWGATIVRRAAAVIAFVTVVLVPAKRTLMYTYMIPPPGTMDIALHGAKGYRAPARSIVGMVPKGAVLGALQTGALGYYGAQAGITVVNCDGVVDREAARAFRDRRLADFARARGVDYFADWDFNTGVFLDHSGDPTWTRESLTPIGDAPPQAIDHFTLYRLPSSAH